MRAMRHVRAWCQPGQQGLLGLGFIVSLLLLGSHTPVIAQSALQGKTQSAIGTLVVIRPDKIEDRLQGQGTLQLYEGDVLRTEAASQALITIQEGTEVALNENTTLKLLYRWEKARGITQILRLQQGEIWVKTGPGPTQLEVETPVATAAVRGTEFNITLIGSRALAACGDVDGSSAANNRPWSRKCTARLFRRSDARASAHGCAGTRSVRRAGAGSVG